MLSAPRSFSSLVSTMIGQHPQIYGFPELHIMLRETVGAALEASRRRERYLGPPGLLRSMAELMYGGQTDENVLTAANWLEDHAHWRSKDVIDLVATRAEQVTGRPFCLEKSPIIAFNPIALERIRQAWPDALYIHLTRNPVTFIRSLEEFIDKTLTRLTEEEKEVRRKRALTAWPVTQRNLLDFCASLAPGQSIRIRGEDVLSDAASVMRQVAEWVGVRTDDEAIGCMLRPEESPYASLGPANAAFGNDTKFILSPAFRPGKPRTDGLKEYIESGGRVSLSPSRKEYLMYLAGCLGYS